MDCRDPLEILLEREDEAEEAERLHAEHESGTCVTRPKQSSDDQLNDSLNNAFTFLFS